MTKILWVSESNLLGKPNRNDNNIRTDVAWIIESGGTHLPFSHVENYNKEEQFDIGIIILPKREELLSVIKIYDTISKLKKFCGKLGVMQEGPCDYFKDYTVEIQFWFYSTLSKMDFILAHNVMDKKYYEEILNNTVPVFVNKSLMITENLNRSQLIKNKKDKVICGGNFVSWYNGFDSYLVAKEFDLPIYAPSMGRKPKDEGAIDDLCHLPYMNWKQWIKNLSEFKYAVHLMPTAAAGTFSLNCGWLGIPCIGNEKIDTQFYLFPELSVDYRNLSGAKLRVEELKKNFSFYKECSNYAMVKWKELYSEKVWKQNWNNIVNEIKKIN